MIKYFFKFFLRTAKRNFISTVVKFLVLSLSLTFFLLLSIFVSHELSYDSFYENKNNIYRLEYVEYLKRNIENEKNFFDSPNDNIRKTTALPLPLPVALKNELPEIKSYTRYSSAEIIIQQQENIYKEKVNFVDSNFVDFFSFPALKTSQKKPLPKNGIILTSEVAKKYFGQENPIGKTLLLTMTISGEKKPFVISDVISQIPSNSSLKFSILTRIENHPFYPYNENQWGTSSTPCFIELDNETNIEEFKNKLRSFTEKQYKDEIETNRIQSGLGKNEKSIDLTISKLTSIHFKPSFKYLDYTIFPINLLVIFIIALLVIIAGSLNYIAMTVSTISGRKKEITLKRIYGLTEYQIGIFFWLESLLFVIVSFLFSIFLVFLLMK